MRVELGRAAIAGMKQFTMEFVCHLGIMLHDQVPRGAVHLPPKRTALPFAIFMITNLITGLAAPSRVLTFLLLLGPRIGDVADDVAAAALGTAATPSLGGLSVVLGVRSRKRARCS